MSATPPTSPPAALGSYSPIAGLRAIEDRDRCCGYFPALAGTSAIRTELPAYGVPAEVLPEISHGGTTYRFNFLRLSLVCQSADPVIHLDSMPPPR